MGFIFNAVRSLIKTIIKLSLFLALLATVIVLIPNLPPYSKFTSIEITPIQPRVGPLAINSALNNAGKSYNGKLLGPEAFQVFKGELYTSLATGEIVKLSPEGHVTFVTTVGQPCSGIIHEHICGRPLGIEIDEEQETLYVADAYHGIWKVNLKTNKKQLLVSPRVEIEKRQPKLFNSLALAKNGDFYWSDSTSDFHLKDGAISMMTDPSGRLFHYDAAKNQSKVLLDNLWFPNGVVLSPNNDFVLVSETFRFRVLKYYVSGPKKGQTEVFVDGIPGVPDNARALPDGSGVLVALYNVFEPERPPITQLLAATPLVRKLAARLQRLIEIPFEYLNTIYPHIIFEEIVYFVGHFKSVSGLTPPLSGLLQIDWDGNIVAGYYNTDKTLGQISDAIVFNDKLYTGSPHGQDFVGTVPVPPLLKKAFESSKKSDLKVEKKPIQQEPIKKTGEKPEAKVEEKPKVETKPQVEKTAEKKAKVENEAPKVAKPAAVPPKPPQQAQPAAAKPSAETKAPQQAPKAPHQAPKAPQQPPKVPQQPPKAPQQAPKAPQQAPKAPQQPPKAPQQPPKAPSPTKPAPAAAKPEPTKAPTKTEPKPTTPKPEVKTTPPPKPTEKNTLPPQKKTPTETKTEAPKKAQSATKQETPKTAEIKPKPIKEEIPSDTAKPTKETLKVIKRDGPAEIHVPNQ